MSDTAVATMATTPTGRPRRPVRVQVYEKKGKGRGTFDFRFLAPNGAITGTSGGQGYTSRRDAHRALNAYLKALAVPGDRVHIEDV